MQAMNQLLALQAKQSIQSQRLQITQDRTASLEQARQAAATERAREVRRRFLGDGTPDAPQSVTDREGGGEGRNGSVRVETGGRGIIKKKTILFQGQNLKQQQKHYNRAD